MPQRPSHLSYYDYQVEARGIGGADDVRRDAAGKAFLYDRLLLPRLPADRSQPVVELACGHGAFLIWAAGRGFQQLSGIDSSPAQIEAARAAGARVDLAEAIGWLEAQPGASVAAVVAIDLIEHLAKDDFLALLSGTSRVLQPGGVLFLRYPNGDSPLVGMNLFNDITHVWTYTGNCLATLGRMHGFAGAEFADEGWRVARDHRWLKLPFGWLGELALRLLFRTVTRENVERFSPHGWAFLRR